MNLEIVRTELELLGVVSLLEEKNNMLFISINTVSENQSSVDFFNEIVNNYILSTYPILEVFALEGGSIKAIYKK